MKVLVGADPEIFISGKTKLKIPKPLAPRSVKWNARTSQYEYPTPEFVEIEKLIPLSAHGLIPGTKKKPHPVKDGAVQIDGTALEFNITPAETSKDFVHNIQSVMSQLKEMIPSQYSFTKDIYAHFHDIASYPKETREIGCDPDFNAYTEKKNNTFSAETLRTLRMVGGHVHIGWTENADPNDYSHFLSCCQLAKQMDFMLYLPSLVFDSDMTRRSYYGQPGAFRPKPYGMEYRTLSNFWIHDTALMEMVFNQTIKGFNLFVDKELDLNKKYGGVIQRHNNDSFNSRFSVDSLKASAKQWVKQYPEVYEDIKELVVNA